jgi:putative cardiolipin synthase
MIEADAPYMRTLATGEPLAALLSGKSSLVWAKAEVIYDSLEKAKVQDGELRGRLLRHRLGEVANQVQSELLIVSPYLIPGTAGMSFLEGLRERNVSVRILTTLHPTRYTRAIRGAGAIAEKGVELYEVRPARARVVRGMVDIDSGRYALHARSSCSIGAIVHRVVNSISDRCTQYRNRLIIDSPELAARCSPLRGHCATGQ